MKKKIVIPKNYLENIPKRTDIKWEKDDGGLVTLIVENKGWVNRIAQVFFKRPNFSNIHLDENGSFVWLLIDGETDIIKIGEKVKERFGENAEPLYERLAQFFKMLEGYHFVEM